MKSSGNSDIIDIEIIEYFTDFFCDLFVQSARQVQKIQSRKMYQCRPINLEVADIGHYTLSILRIKSKTWQH